MQKKLREQIGQNGCSEKNQPNLEQRLEIHISGRFGELIRNYAGERVPRLEERRRDLRRVADHHCDRHGFAESASEAKNDRAEQAFLCVTKHRDPGCFPACRAERVGGFAL